jgi:RNA polymerase sigma-70 factor (ECF subfamily)
MPEDYRRVIELRHFEALPFRQIGEQLGRSENAAQLLHAQALTRLDELVSPQ